jgi:2-methylcitrate dehydratase PrpD
MWEKQKETAMGTTEKVARFIVDFEFNQVPPKGIEQAKMSILDTIGTALVGAAGSLGAILRDFVKEAGGTPQVRLIGNGIRTSILNSALANGTFAHADDFDDHASFGHAGVVLTPPLLALGEHLRIPGKKILEAYAVGFEVGDKLRGCLGGVEIQGGFHSTSLLGTLCAAAESAKLLGLGVDQTRAALGIAASLASGIVQNFGTQAKPLHAGHAARNGVMAAVLAKKGFTGDPDILEGSRGFVYVYGQQQADIKRMTENLGRPLAIAGHGVTIKPWPFCGANQEAMTAILRLIDRHDVTPEQVDAIQVATPSKPPGVVIRPHPRNGLEAKFSLPYTLATALVDRKIDLDTYSDEKFRRPIVQDLMRRVDHVWHKDFRDRPLRLQGEVRFALVTLRLKNGQVLSEQSDVSDRKNLRGDEIYAKYKDNAGRGGIELKKVERAIQIMKSLEDLEDMTELMDNVTY